MQLQLVILIAYFDKLSHFCWFKLWYACIDWLCSGVSAGHWWWPCCSDKIYSAANAKHDEGPMKSFYRVVTSIYVRRLFLMFLCLCCKQLDDSFVNVSEFVLHKVSNLKKTSIILAVAMIIITAESPNTIADNVWIILNLIHDTDYIRPNLSRLANTYLINILLVNLWTLSQFIRNKGCGEEFWEFFRPGNDQRLGGASEGQPGGAGRRGIRNMSSLVKSFFLPFDLLHAEAHVE